MADGAHDASVLDISHHQHPCFAFIGAHLVDLLDLGTAGFRCLPVLLELDPLGIRHLDQFDEIVSAATLLGLPVIGRDPPEALEGVVHVVDMDLIHRLVAERGRPAIERQTMLAPVILAETLLDRRVLQPLLESS